MYLPSTPVDSWIFLGGLRVKVECHALPGAGLVCQISVAQALMDNQC